MKPAQESLKKKLTPIQYAVTQTDSTEPSGTGAYLHNTASGLYVDIVSDEVLFTSLDKFDSGCGWPAFSKPAELEHIQEREDRSLGRIRTEVRSKNADSHLGHVFNDGPAELGGMRYCINSAALRFVPLEDLEKEGYRKYLYLFE